MCWMPCGANGQADQCGRSGLYHRTEAKLAKMISEVTPGDLDYVFFTNGGAEANENAIKAVRWFTGRH